MFSSMNSLLWCLCSYLMMSTVFGLIVAVLDAGAGTMPLVILVCSVINMVIQTGIQPEFIGDAVGAKADWWLTGRGTSIPAY